VLLTMQAERYRQAGDAGAAEPWHAACARCCGWRRGRGPAAGAGRLGQHQLRGAGLQRLSDLPGQLVAAHGLRPGLQLWRPLGEQGGGGLLSFAALTAIHYTHRLFAYGVLALLLALVWGLHRAAALPRRGGHCCCWRCCSWPRACPTWCWAGRCWPRWCTPAAARP
jgi:hypothetical protein